ncbi:ABC transporter permease [Pedobacter panaciterrae]|uniref:ABC transporter permease n=1 Tax=Pedobacter panaciterrae TaxID=363849 RepID=UPI00155D8D40|nr:ABC transporter permease [Pedobacter panaciterrae]NQX53360.1 ABC transporter permease [Pedobacter panaciterrae]
MDKLSLKIAWRNLWKNKGFTLINLGGLAIGLAASLLLLLYVANEWKFNTQYKDAENIYEVKTNFLDAAGKVFGTTGVSPNALPLAMRSELAGVKAAAFITWPSQTLLVNGTTSVKVDNRIAEPDILKILSYKFISGSAETAFSKPNSVILTSNTAKRLFPNTSAIGKSLKFMNFANLTVTGIIEDLPENMSYRFESLVSTNENVGIFPKAMQWDNYSFYTLLKLNSGVNVDDFNKNISNFLNQHSNKEVTSIFIYPLLKSNLYGDFINGKPAGGKIGQVRIFIGLAIGILIIACINFMNLATAKAGKRAKEVGIKKAMGAGRGSLIHQFLLEAILMVSFSFILAITIVEISLPLFNNLLHVNLTLQSLGFTNWLYLCVVVFITALLSGSYPAFYLSAFQPVDTVKGLIRQNGSSVTLRKALVVVQFSFAVLLITGTIVVYNQLQYLRNRPMGYNSTSLVEMPMEGMLFQNYDALKNRLVQSGAVLSMCKTTASISTQNSVTSGLEWEDMLPADKSLRFNQIITTNDFSNTTGVKMVIGRDFSKDIASDSSAIMLNSSAVKAMNLQQPIGKKVLYEGIRRTVIGVFEDIIWADPTKKEMPMVVAWGPFLPNVITMRLNSARSTKEALATITKITKEMNPVYPVDLEFVDSLYQEKFERERVLSILSNLFGGLSIFISCLGLLGLSAYSAELRTKEIGIRKVLGASHVGIVNLLSWNFVKMVLIAICIGLPLSYYLMNIWLSKFDFRTEITGFMMFSSAGFIVLIAYLTVSYQAVRAASANPINAIKYE